MRFIPVDDNLAISAGKMVYKYRKNSVSVVDSFILACGKKQGARIITTDPGIKNASKSEKVSVDFIPFKEIQNKRKN